MASDRKAVNGGGREERAGSGGALRGAPAVFLLFLAVAFLTGSGCAAYMEMSAPAYGKAWETFAVQAGSGSVQPPASPPSRDSATRIQEWKHAFRKIPKARKAVSQVERLLQDEAPSRSELRGAMAGLEEVEKEVEQLAAADPALLEGLRVRIAEIRASIEEKLLEVLRIEPAFDITSRARVRVAVVKIGEGVETIRAPERARWKAFLSQAGFSPDPVFIPACLAGNEPSAADLRVAGARLGAQAVLVYTTFAATDSSILGESAAVLSFAKCMVVDTRTEYLYLNAEGECRLRRVSLPFTVCSLCLEEECLVEAVESLRGEITHELERLAETD